MLSSRIPEIFRSSLRGLPALITPTRWLLPGILATACLVGGCGGGGNSSVPTGVSRGEFNFPVITSSDTVTRRFTYYNYNPPASEDRNDDIEFGETFKTAVLMYQAYSDQPITTQTLDGVGTVSVAAQIRTYEKNRTYSYFKTDSTGFYFYGTDYYNDQPGQSFEIKTRANPPLYFPSPFVMTPGKAISQTVRMLQTNSNSPNDTPIVVSTIQNTITLSDYEDVTVPAGTFHNVAKLNVKSAYLENLYNETDTVTTSGRMWFSSGLGDIQTDLVETYENFGADGKSMGASTEPKTTSALVYASLNGQVTGTSSSNAESRAAGSVKALTVKPGQ